MVSAIEMISFRREEARDVSEQNKSNKKKEKNMRKRKKRTS